MVYHIFNHPRSIYKREKFLRATSVLSESRVASWLATP